MAEKLIACLFLIAVAVAAEPLPGAYFPLLAAGADRVEKRLDAEPAATLERLESGGAPWRHFPYSILAPAVLYTRRHPANKRFEDPRMLALAIRIGDLLAAEHERGKFEPRPDSDWDTYMWLETWRILQDKLGPEKKARWRAAIEANITPLIRDATDRLDFPWYHSPFIGTSPNHYVQWATLLHLGGLLFDKPEWKALGARILRRFALTEQSPDGFWGEHNRDGPTPGYNHLTLTGVALYWEHSRDPDVMPALRRAMEFHRHYTLLDGTPVDVINDRNRYWGVSPWAHFAFSHWPDGRGYAEFLTGFFHADALAMDALGRLAQGALYYHEGPSTPAPQLAAGYRHQMSIPAGIRKSGPWQVALSGLINTQAINSRFYLDRQGHISVFHERLGLIVTGANSKRQPELATFTETVGGQVVHMPITSRLQMPESGEDRLSLAYNTFFSDVYMSLSSDRLDMRFVISGRGRPGDDPRLTLQLKLTPGKALATAAGEVPAVGSDALTIPGAGWIRHNGWTLRMDPEATLRWPVYPHNPYSDSPETDIRRAVATVSVPLRLKAVPGRYVRANEQTIQFRLSVP